MMETPPVARLILIVPPIAAVVSTLRAVPNELFISSVPPESSSSDLTSIASLKAKLEGMIIDEDGAKSTNVARISLAARRTRYNLSPLAYSKPNQRISANDITAYLAEEAPKNGEHFEISATVANPRLGSSQSQQLAKENCGTGSQIALDIPGSTPPSSVLLTCLPKNVSARLDDLEPEKGPFRKERVTRRPKWTAFNCLFSQTTMPCT